MRNHADIARLRVFGWNAMNHRTRIIVLYGFASAISSLAAAPSSASPPATQVSEGKPSEGIYRLPFADGTKVKVFDDFHTHRPMGRIDLFAIEGREPYRVVAAAAGRIVAIQDSYDEQQSGRAAADCHNNYVWIAHANGEWTNYSHVAHGSTTQKAKLKIGDRVEAGQYIGDEDAIGCAMLKHVHFEVAVPKAADAIDAGGFLVDNEGGKREREPRFCGVDGRVVKDAVFTAVACDAAAKNRN
jgi:murein DD-endopeptidase MepM/ murein hydrolase activator NlpD